MFDDESVFEEKRLKQMKALRDVAYNIIDLVSQFEDELVKIWNKPKFAHSANYVLTLDKIEQKDAVLLRKLLRNKSVSQQIKEWQALGMCNEKFNISEVIKDKKLSEQWKYLPLDTQYFKQFEYDILALFDDLDNQLDGWLIHSENYQALNTLRGKFREKVQCIYIDPPFNLGSNADYEYLVNYKDATWASLLENRLILAKSLLKDTGGIFVRCDYNGNWIVKNLLDNIFGKENFRNELVINKSNKQGVIDKRFNPSTETIFLCSKTIEFLLNPQLKKREKKRDWLQMHSPKENKESHTTIFNNVLFIAPKGRHWTFSQETVNKLITKNRIRVIDKEYTDVYGNKQNKFLNI